MFSRIGRGHGDGIIINLSPIPLGVLRVKSDGMILFVKATAFRG